MNESVEKVDDDTYSLHKTSLIQTLKNIGEILLFARKHSQYRKYTGDCHEIKEELILSGSEK